MRRALSRSLLQPLPHRSLLPSLPALPIRQQRCYRPHRVGAAKFPAPRPLTSPHFICSPLPPHRITLTPALISPARAHDHTFHSGVDLFSVSAVLVLLCVGYGLQSVWSQSDSQNSTPDIFTDESLPDDDMAQQALPGRPGNLTKEQEEKLLLLWTKVLNISGVGDPNDTDPKTNGLDSAAPSEPEAEQPKKKHGFWSSKKSSTPASPSANSAAAAALDDKYGQTQEYHDAIATLTPEQLHKTIWGMIKFDDPDAVMLRFLRARKWDVDRALVMLVSTMKWRITEMRVDEDVMVNGEEYAAAAAEKDPFMKDFITHFRMGKTYLHGVDRGGHPLCITRVRLHKPNELSNDALNRYTIFILEQGRMTISPPVDTATVIFDLTGFSLANMDYTPVKFVIKALEANYPECLESVLVHKAPWIFQGIWKVIKGWLDPVVASKVHFTNNVKDLEVFIEPSRIPKEMEGQEDWEYKYIEPVPGENDKMKDTATRDKVIEQHNKNIAEYDAATRRWIAAKGSETEEGKGVKAERAQIMQKLKESYWETDPYTRARSILDREGVIKGAGKVDFYPAKAPAATEAAPANGTTA
ncbi:phosphatidylinositol transfer protein CSR1 [Plectosphaerella plurivora]|uniref:Phosphatidylinositol transfer protein CSR1 n=1 Tax=Plectosphaerella plurivora TaxID=936078 RepID=A0A9P8V215_9PEZI|nr:phosphatidylinositol transfer protein CSR1 [Plectosphaerella plurivora]